MRKSHTLSKRLKRDRQLYLFLLIPVIYVFIFKYLPMGGLVVAFEKFSIRKGIFGSKWVGWDNFIKFIQSQQFKIVLKNTLILSAYTILASFPIPIIFALIFNCIPSKRLQKITQSVVCLPHFISVTVMVGIVFQLLNARSGLYGNLIMHLTGQYPKDLFSTSAAFRHIYVWSGVWQGFGWSSVVYIAALANVSPELHEAAQLDGSSRFQRILHVDLPAILPTIITLLILRMGSVMSIGHEKVFLLQNDLNLSASQVISTYVYHIGLSASGQTDLGLATAVGLFNGLVNLILITVVNKISSKVSETSLW